MKSTSGRVQRTSAPEINGTSVLAVVTALESNLKLNSKKRGRGHSLAKIRNSMARHMNFTMTTTNQESIKALIRVQFDNGLFRTIRAQ